MRSMLEGHLGKYLSLHVPGRHVADVGNHGLPLLFVDSSPDELIVVGFFLGKYHIVYYERTSFLL